MKYHDDKTGANSEIIGETLWLPGTADGTDIRQDLNFLPVIKHGAIGHRGAYLQAEWIFAHVPLDNVTEIRGHSLGGAVGLWLGLMTGIQVVTFGTFKTFLWRPRGKAINYRYLSDPISWIFWPIGRNYGHNVTLWKCPGFNDHNAYEGMKY